MEGILPAYGPGSRLPAHRSKDSRLPRSVPCLQMNGPPRPQGLKVVLKLPKSQASKNPGQAQRTPHNPSEGQAAQPLKKRKRPEEQGSVPNGWPQPSFPHSGDPLSRTSESLGTAPRPQHSPGSKKSKLAPPGLQIKPVDPFATQAQPAVKPRLTVKVAGQPSTPLPDWSSPQPGPGTGPSTVKVGSLPPSKQQKGLKVKKKKAAELSPSDPALPPANGLAGPPGHLQPAAQRPKLKVKQAQASRPPAPAPSNTNISEPSASALTEDDASFQQQRPMGATTLSNTAAAEQRPDIPVTRPDILRVVDRVQQKDWYEIFKEPVTDAVVRLLAIPCMMHWYFSMKPCDALSSALAFISFEGPFS